MHTIIVLTHIDSPEVVLAKLGGGLARHARRHIKDDVPEAEVEWLPPATKPPFGGPSGTPALRGLAQ